jgi:heat shock protein HslJ
MMGTFELDGTSLHFNPAATTMMACPDPLMKEERTFIAGLQSVTRFELDGQTLELLAGDRVVARFEAESPSQSVK